MGWLKLVDAHKSYKQHILQQTEKSFTEYLEDFYHRYHHFVEALSITLDHRHGFECLYLTPTQKLVNLVLRYLQTQETCQTPAGADTRQTWRSRKKVEDDDEILGLVVDLDYHKGFGPPGAEAFFKELSEMRANLSAGQELLMMMDKHYQTAMGFTSFHNEMDFGITNGKVYLH